MTDKFWLDRYSVDAKVYTCPWCWRDLKPKISNSAKNPGKSFVSCSKDYGGCGLFCFLNEQPNDKFNPNNASKPAVAKRAKTTEGTNIVGPIAADPSAVEQRLAELVTAVQQLQGAIAAVHDYVKQVNE